MNKKTIIGVSVGVLVVAAAVIAYFVYAAGAYAQYSSAFSKTFKNDSFEINTSIQASVDGSNISSTGNFKLKGMKGNPQFLNTMQIDGKAIIQFCDGVYIYTDDGNTKNKIEMGATPEKRQEKEDTDFSYDAYIGEFSSLLDAGKIKELNTLDPIPEKYVDKIEKKEISDGTQYTVTLLPQIVDDMIATVLTEKLSDPKLNPAVTVNSITYSATVKNGYVSVITLKVDMDVTAPEETAAKAAEVIFTLNPVNPGQTVSFSLPDTNGF
ncbi:MAG: hypothetical protein FWE80_00990 [Oscillospiraceae bacterium]|nr:hypothetical protein [Oscillospiraceae bacterium]